MKGTNMVAVEEVDAFCCSTSSSSSAREERKEEPSTPASPPTPPSTQIDAGESSDTTRHTSGYFYSPNDHESFYLTPAGVRSVASSLDGLNVAKQNKCSTFAAIEVRRAILSALNPIADCNGNGGSDCDSRDTADSCTSGKPSTKIKSARSRGSQTASVVFNASHIEQQQGTQITRPKNYGRQANDNNNRHLSSRMREKNFHSIQSAAASSNHHHQSHSTDNHQVGSSSAAAPTTTVTKSIRTSNLFNGYEVNSTESVAAAAACNKSLHKLNNKDSFDCHSPSRLYSSHSYNIFHEGQNSFTSLESSNCHQQHPRRLVRYRPNDNNNTILNRSSLSLENNIHRGNINIVDNLNNSSSSTKSSNSKHNIRKQRFSKERTGNKIRQQGLKSMMLGTSASRQDIIHYKQQQQKQHLSAAQNMSATIHSIQSLSMQLDRAATFGAFGGGPHSSSSELSPTLNDDDGTITTLQRHELAAAAAGSAANNGKMSANKIGRLMGKKASRVKELLLQNLGRADRTTDELFEMYEENFFKQQNHANKLAKEFRQYMSALKGFHEASKSLNKCVQTATSDYQSARHDLVCEQLTQLEQLNEDLLEKLRDQVMQTVGDYLAQFMELKEKIAKRRRKLIDYDSSRRLYELTLAQVNKKRLRQQLQQQQQQQEATATNDNNNQHQQQQNSNGIVGSLKFLTQNHHHHHHGHLTHQSSDSLAANQLVDEARLLKLREQFNFCKIMYETINSELHEELPIIYEKKMKSLLMTLQSYFAIESHYHSNAGRLFSTASEVIDELPTNGLMMLGAGAQRTLQERRAARGATNDEDDDEEQNGNNNVDDDDDDDDDDDNDFDEDEEDADEYCGAGKNIDGNRGAINGMICNSGEQQDGAQSADGVVGCGGGGSSGLGSSRADSSSCPDDSTSSSGSGSPDSAAAAAAAAANSGKEFGPLCRPQLQQSDAELGHENVAGVVQNGPEDGGVQETVMAANGGETVVVGSLATGREVQLEQQRQLSIADEHATVNNGTKMDEQQNKSIGGDNADQAEANEINAIGTATTVVVKGTNEEKLVEAVNQEHVVSGRIDDDADDNLNDVRTIEPAITVNQGDDDDNGVVGLKKIDDQPQTQLENQLAAEKLLEAGIQTEVVTIESGQVGGQPIGSSDCSGYSPNGKGNILYKVMTNYKYLAEDVDELCFEADEVIQVIEFDESHEPEEGWLLGIRELNGQRGLFPANFTRPI